MTVTLTVRLPGRLAREFKNKAKAAKTTPSAVLRRAAAEYIKKTGNAANELQEHIIARAGTWDGHCSGEELLKRTRP